MSKTQEPATEAASASSPGPFKSVVGTIIGGVLGLVALVAIVSLVEQAPDKKIQELPHAAVLVDLGGASLQIDTSRTMLVNLQRRLAATGLTVSGPADYPFLVPASAPGQEPKLMTLAEIHNGEIDQAMPYLSGGGWLVPRVYSPDLRQAIIRLAPPGTSGQFPSGSKEQILEALKPIGTESPGAQAWVYSRALGLESDEARNRINITFGVQTAPVHVRSAEGKLWQPESYASVVTELQKLRDPRLRSVTSFGSWAMYVSGVLSHNPNVPQLDDSVWSKAVQLAKAGNLPAMISPDGKSGVIDVTTEAEGKDNLDIANLVAAHAQSDGLNAYVPRDRPTR